MKVFRLIDRKYNLNCSNKDMYWISISYYLLALCVLLLLLNWDVPWGNWQMYLSILGSTFCLIILLYGLYKLFRYVAYTINKFQKWILISKNKTLIRSISNMDWDKFAVIDTVTYINKRMYSYKFDMNKVITQYDNIKRINSYNLFVTLINYFEDENEIDKQELKKIRTFLSIKFDKIQKHLKFNIIINYVFWIMLIWLLILNSDSNYPIKLNRINNLSGLIKNLLINFSGVIKQMWTEDKIFSVSLIIYAVLVFGVLPLSIIDIKVRDENERSILLAAIDYVLNTKHSD